MSAEHNKALVRQIFEELRAGNRRALLKRVAEDCTWTVIGTTPVSGVFHGRNTFYEKVLSAITSRLAGSVTPTVVQLIAEGDQVVLEWRGESVTESGQPYNNRYCWILTLKDDLIYEGRIYADTALINQVLAAG